ncbi:serine-rich adhesin for platelets isoform X2 [Toxorhynchites rutilus septentrionalis]|uniref:serine-rich adhesin for platelets isoform X2 n=1 Tax=Toxorhynchites rutilus septentrionalis TaxID=329112 RepID=UPI0024786649|nr:serine-rich adhesin for platelets isoform X2 [Toxorhynchites rutilus septentrionalis]XP_055628973.1 serine-rich adhesin for platelets isoform X2 [Toxorhynchites rutilus septentrionalis]
MEHIQMETMDNDEYDMDMGMAQNDENDLPQSAVHFAEICDDGPDGDFKEHYEYRFDGSWSDNNLNEKQNYADQEKENDPEYNEEYRPVVDPFLEIPDPPENLELQRCPICARNFVPTSLVKHIGICEKMQTKKRKPFDSSRQRREGTELASYLPKNFGLPQNHPQTRTSPPKTIPTQKHNINKTPNPERKDYGSAMSCSQTLSSTTAASTNNVAVGATSTPRPALKRNLSQQNEPCPYCERCFGFKAYDRHVEWCREKALLSKNVQNSQMISAAKERLQARIQYKAPQIRSKRALNREKYSGSLSCGGSTNSLADLDLPLPRHRSHLNSMSSSISSDNKSDHSASSKKLSLNGSNSQFQPSMVKSMGAAEKREQRTNPLTVGSNNNSNPPNDKTRTGKIFSNNLLIRPTQEVRKEKEQAVAVERIEKMELIGRGDQRVPLKRGATKIVKCNKSGFTPDKYDPFLSAKRQLEELFSPSSSFNTSTPRQQISNSRATTPLTPTAAMSKSVAVPANKTSPIINSNFRRASSLRMPRKVSRPMYIEKAKSNIQKGITDDGPVSPNFLKSSEYDEIPIKSAFNALQMAEKPKMRDSSATRRNLKLDIKDPNMPTTDVPLSKTDSLAAFLKYEHELTLAAMSEKDMKDKSNSLSKRSYSLGGSDRKDSMLYGGITGNALKLERSLQDEKGKSEKVLQDIQAFKKIPQKLVPIKLEPINITYNNSISHRNLNDSGSKNSDSQPSNTPTVISLDAILGKNSKPSIPPTEEKDNRTGPNYIDPKLINRCDNLPITDSKLSSSDSDCSGQTIEVQKRSPGPNRLSDSLNISPETTTGGGGIQTKPMTDNRLSDISTISDTSDKRPTLSKQNCTTSSSTSRESSREESPVEQTPRIPLTQSQSHDENAKCKTQEATKDRAVPKSSTPIQMQKKPERPPLPSFDDFDFDEFITSFEDDRKSFQKTFYPHNPNSTSNNSSGSISNTRTNSLNNDSRNDNSVKSVASFNGSNSSTNSPSHVVVSPNNHPYYKSLNNNTRSEEADTKHPVPQQPPNRTRESPQVPRRGRAVGDLVEPLATTTIRNLPSLPTSSATSQPMEKSPSSQSMKSNITVPIGAYKPANDTNNNSSHIRNGPTATRLGNGNNSFNSPLPTTVRHQQQQKQQQNQLQSSAMNNNTISTHSLPQPYTTTGSPLFDNPSHKHQSSLTSSNGIGHNGAGGGGIMFDDLSPTERDLMKSVQELDRMCESSSSMYPADSDEMSSVEGYPLSASSRGHNSGRPSAEGSKFSADSAYGSLSRHSPSDQQHTIRRAHHHHHLHRGNKSNPSQQDAFDNSSGSESSLPPISATLKTQKAELHPHKDHKTVVDSMGNLAGPMSKFCHECGSRFMINTAKFCMECGVRRIMLE